MIRFFSWMLLLPTVAGFLLALQDPTSAERNVAPSYRVKAYSALLEVRVLETTGRPVGGLKAADFRVSAAGKPRPLLLFEEHREGPVSLAVLIDVGSNMTQERVGIAKQAILELIHLLDPSDQIAVAVFAAETEFLAELTSDRLLLLEALTNVSAGSEAGFWKKLGTAFASTALTGPAIDEALLRLKKATHEVKVVLVFSSAFGSLGRGTLDHLHLSGARVFAVGWSNRAGDAFNLWGDRTSRNRILDESGGVLFSGMAIRERVDALARAMKSYYLMAYDPPEEDRGLPEVTLPNRPGLKVTVLRRVATDNAFY